MNFQMKVSVPGTNIKKIVWANIDGDTVLSDIMRHLALAVEDEQCNINCLDKPIKIEFMATRK